MLKFARQRRNFLGGLAGLWAGAAAAQTNDGRRPAAGASNYRLPAYALRQDYESLKQSSYDRTGGNSDRWPVAPGETKEIFNAQGPGVLHVIGNFMTGSAAPPHKPTEAG